ncbi:MAG TPA: iron ABC transporter permease [Alphaproteobacteria bacterium]|nr:iron ABC transporter permease [Alphaproteobacteria bacterium]
MFVFALSLAIGAEPIPVQRLFAALIGSGQPVDQLILADIRLPRALLGAAVGASLGLAGAALQGLLRNPLVEPGLIGVSGGASLGAVLALYGGLSLVSPIAVPVAGFAGALVATMLLAAAAARGARATILVLFGVALGSLTGALTALALNLAPSPFAILEIVFWLLGSVSDRSMVDVWLALPPMAVGWLLLLTAGRGMEALTLGEPAAQSLGLDIKRFTLRVILGTALAVGPAVAVTGTIGFVGLVVPHVIRPWVGHRPGAVMGASALGGALLLLLADIVVRLAPTAAELKLGVVTSLIGAPYFIFLLVRRQRGAV